jgi:hypothetical protein
VVLPMDAVMSGLPSDEGEAPGFGSGLDVLNVDAVRRALLELHQEAHRVVGSDEYQPITGCDPVEGTEDRSVPDGVRDRPGVKLGQPCRFRLATGTHTRTAPGVGRLLRPGACLLVIPPVQ